MVPPGLRKTGFKKRMEASRLNGLLVPPAASVLDMSGRKIPVAIMHMARRENFRASQKAVSYLIRKGHKRIGAIQQSPESVDSIERFEGYCTALMTHGIKFDPALIAQTDWRHEIRGGRYGNPRDRGARAALKILRRKNRPTALFCANDETAMGALQAVRKLGLRCPQEVAIMGFDGLAAGELTDPSLTTVTPLLVRATEQAVKSLMRAIDGKSKALLRQDVPMTLLIRRSA